MDNNATATATLSAQVAEEVRALMARRRVSGRRLAELLDVSPSWVSYRMTGVTPIGLDDLQRIAEVLGVDVVDLLPPRGSREGRTVVVSGSRAGQTTVSYPPVTVQPRPLGHPKRTGPPASSRRPARLLHA